MNVKNVDSFYKKTEKELKKTVNKGQFDNKPVVISNDLARQNTLLTLEDEKLLHCIFSQLDFNSKNPTKIELKKIDLFEKLELNSESRYSDVKKRLKGLIHKSMVDVTDHEGTEHYGVVIINATSSYKSDSFTVQLNPNFMFFLEEMKNFYTRLELDSIVQFDSKFSLTLYKYLSSWRTDHYHRMLIMTTKELKDLFGLSKDDYMSNGKFDRFNFERYTLDTAVKEINGKVPWWSVSWKKIKKGNRVTGYQLEWLERDRIQSHNQSVSDEQFQLDYEAYKNIDIEKGQLTLEDYEQ